MVKVKVRRFGNSLGIVLPKQVVARLNIRAGAVLELAELPDGGFRLVSFDTVLARKTTVAENIVARYPNTLRILAK